MQQQIDQDDVLTIVALEHYRTHVDHDILREHCAALASEFAERNGINVEDAEENLLYNID